MQKIAKTTSLSAILSAGVEYHMRANAICRPHISGRKHSRAAFIGAAALALLMLWAGCSYARSFPAGFVRFASQLDAWENRNEGFRLVLITSGDRVQGFLEWNSQGIYGRIVQAQKNGRAVVLTLGDGGMNGLKLSVSPKRKSIIAEYLPKDKSALQPFRIEALHVSSEEGMRVLGATFAEKLPNERALSLRLQYVSDRDAARSRMLDEILRRGMSPYNMAELRLAQQKEATAEVRNRAPPPQEYEEIEYPVFISDQYLSIATQHYLFDGGAHGAASTTFDIIDRAKGKRLSAQDIFTGDWKAGLKPLLAAELMRQSTFWMSRGIGFDLKALGLFEAELDPSDNIFVCGVGVGFQYDRYQIAPWYMGEFIIVLPWNELTPYLSPAFRIPQ